jgi:Holliday junction resolvase
VSSANKAKGSQWERDVVSYFRASGFPDAERRYGAGVREDKGDIRGVPGITLECKNQKSIDLAQFVAEAELEAQYNNTPYGAAVIKRRGKGVAAGYVVMSLQQFVLLLKERGM